MKSIEEWVHDRVLEELPQMENLNDRIEAVDRAINHMSNVELLARISDAFASIKEVQS